MNRFLENLKTQAEENPVVAMGVAAGLITAIAGFMNASTNKRNSVAWTKEVNRRVKKS